ncbi:MAG: metallophosphoesterase [Paucibacter sp.]|nr:metallophosphoesterase [Roseateles sp.]
MKLQLLSDLHLETEAYEPEPAPGAELLILAGDIDSNWEGLRRFANWPAPVLFVPGNHEFDRRDVEAARAGLKQLSRDLGFTLLDDSSVIRADAQGRRVRFLGSTRWSDFDLFGEAGRAKALRAAGYFQKVMAATRHQKVFDAEAVRELSLQSRAWLEHELALGESGKDWDATVAITHFAPSIKSADPRYGRQPTTASFCNDDEALMPGARLWLHGHLHCQFDYWLGQTRVMCNARGHAHKGEPAHFQPRELIEVFS